MNDPRQPQPNSSPNRWTTLGIAAALLATIGGATAFIVSRPDMPEGDRPSLSTEVRPESGESPTESTSPPDFSFEAGTEPDVVAENSIPDVPLSLELEIIIEPEVGVAPTDPQVFELQFEGDRLQLVPAPADVDASGDDAAVLTALIEDLLADAATERSAIPAGTQLLSLAVEPEGIYVDLSREFRSGGGSASAIIKVAQILYTTTSIDPDAPIFLLVDGVPVDQYHPLGGEGLVLNQPTTRSDFEEDFELELSLSQS